MRELARAYRVKKYYDGGAGRKELYRQPVLEGLMGPMYDGRKGDVVTIRYETPETYRTLSRAAKKVARAYLANQVRKALQVQK